VVRRLTGIAFLALLSWLSGIALAKPPPVERLAHFENDGARLWVTVDYPELADAALRHKLDSGLSATVVARAYLVREGASRAEALAVQTVRTAYDLWDEVYVSEVSGEAGARVFRDPKRDDALRRLSQLRVPLIDNARLQPGAHYRVAVIVELNPVSKELLSQVRKWLSRPREGAPLDGESYFGSFVSLFVNRKVGEAERVLQLRTQVYP
jgi:hypothetical protein